MITSSPPCSTVRKLSSWRKSCQLLSNEIRKKPNQGADRFEFGGYGKERKRRRKKGPGSSKAYHFYHREGHWKNGCKYQQEWLKKKGQAAEADITLSSIDDNEVLMASYEVFQEKG